MNHLSSESFQITTFLVNLPVVLYVNILQYVQTDIDSHKHPVDAVNEAAAALMKTSDPENARNVRAKLENLNTRYGKISGSTHHLGEYLQKLVEKVNKLQIDVDDFEDWLLPMIQRLEAKELSRMDLLELGSRLMVSTSYSGITSHDLRH